MPTPSRDAPGAPAVDARRTGRAATFALIATAVEKGGAMLLLLLIARILGTDDFGRYAAIMTLVAFVQLAAAFGQEPVLVRLLAQRAPAERGMLLEGALAMRLVFAAGGGVLLVVLGERVLAEVGNVSLALAAAGVVAASGAIVRAWFRTEQRLEWSCLAALANVLAFATALAVARAFGLGLEGAVGAWGVAQLASSTAALAMARGRMSIRPRWRASVTAALARSGWALALNAVLLTVTLRVGQLIVLRAAGPVEVGYLAAGSRLAEAFALLPEALMLVLLPVLSSYDVAARDAQRALSVRVVRWLGLLALTVIVAVSIAAPALLHALFGPRYVPGTPALRISIWLALLAATGSIFTNLLIARGRERLLLAINAVSSTVTIALSLALVPRFGFVAAAAVALAASVLAQLMLWAVPATRDAVSACVRPLRWPLLAALTLAVGGPFIPASPALVALAASAVFVVGVLVTGTITAEDWTVLRRAVWPVQPLTLGHPD
jgi:O-antigen/teichoic acid export membrane protein